MGGRLQIGMADITSELAAGFISESLADLPRNLPIDIEAPLPTDGTDTNWTERLTELVVIVSLMGAGLKLRRPVGWRGWQARGGCCASPCP